MGITSHVMFLIFSLAGWVRRQSSSVGGSKLINKFLPSNYIQSKKWIYAFQLIILIFSFSIDIYSQITDSLNRSKFIKLEDKWYAVDGDDKFLVDESVITVRWKPNISKQAIADFNSKQGVTIIRENILGFVHLRVEKQVEGILQIVKNYLNSELVEIAEPNTYGILGSIPGQPNDTHFGKQWYLDHDWDYDINAPEACTITTGNPQIIVGILDTGVDWLHEDLGVGTDGYQNVWLNPQEDAWLDPSDPNTGNKIDDDGNGYVDDWKGWNFYENNNDTRMGVNAHGTLIAGLIAAKTNNSKGVAGVAGGWGSPGVKVLITKVTTSQSFDNDSVVSAFIGDAILYAVDKGAKVINMSFYAHYDNSLMNSAINYAYCQGCVLVSPAGNGYPELPIWYPARRPEFIAVTGTKKDGSAFPSCAATDSVYQNPVSISAPAGRNTQWDPEDYGIYGLQPGNGYHYYGYGGCYSSAIVSGVVGLILSVRPNLTPAQVRCVLEKTATDMDTVGWDPKFGWGRVNAYRALQAIIIKLISPPNNSVGSIPQTLNWNQLYDATSYSVQVATNINFTNPIFNESGITSTSVEVEGLINNTDYYWHVRADNSICNITPIWSETWKFTTSVVPPPLPPPEEWRNVALQPEEKKPTSFSLSENFPNPFNPITKIKYALVEDAIVTLKIIDILGREIATIVNEQQLAGFHEVDFDGANLPSGVYYYKIQAGKFTVVKKMIILK